jgi:hypothetical protein
VWGDDNGQCGGQGDFVSDTPDQASETYNCVNFPHLDTCSNSYPGIMFMNYMDYSDDDCMSMFTAGQATRMYNEIWNYYPFLLTSNACNNVGIDELNGGFNFSIYPVPSSGKVSIDFSAIKKSGSKTSVLITNCFGQIVRSIDLGILDGQITELDFSSLSKGVYNITVVNNNYSRSNKLVLQ